MTAQAGQPGSKRKRMRSDEADPKRYGEPTRKELLKA